jgi:hypothetical protein
MPKDRRARRSCIAALAVITATLLAGCALGGGEAAEGPDADALEARLDSTFRIDVSDLRITHDYWPRASRIDGSELMRFEMRPGESVPIFHFNPLRYAAGPERRALRSLALDGKRLDPDDRSDVRRIRPGPSAEPAYEIERHLSAGRVHTLRVRWSIPNRDRIAHPDWFYSDFDDTQGPRDETETIWPTISSTEELSRHRFRVRVHGGRRYTVLGSGFVRRRAAGGVQAWDLDTKRPVASDTVLVAAVPSDQVRTTRFDADGVDVRIVSDRSAAVTRRARITARRTIRNLVDDFGQFPMPSMQILLTGWGSGMEYYGATRTGLGSLEHELVHMYFGTTAVNRTWRDTWIDEAVVQWWQRRDAYAPLPSGFGSNVAGGRTAVEPGFDLRAYGAGARILEEVARALGGNQEMVAFLRDLYHRRAFRPFTTDDLIDDVVAAQDEIGRRRLDRWLSSPR